MKREMVYILLLICGAVFLSGKGWALEYEDDALIELEAQKDMMAYVQSTFPLRFGSDLQTGDFVQYELSDHHSGESESEFNSLIVTDRQNNVVTIKEEFEGNVLFYKIDISSNTLLEYWGFDEDGIEQRPSLLSSTEVETRRETMRSQNTRANIPNLPEGITKPVFSSLAQRETFSTANSSLNCLVRALEVPVVEGITPQIRQAVQELTKVYFSESVPKLLPAKLMAVYLDNTEVFEGNAGLVKQSRYQIKDYNKVKR